MQAEPIQVLELIQSNKSFVICFYCQAVIFSEDEVKTHIADGCEEAEKFGPKQSTINGKELEKAQADFIKVATEKSIKFTESLRSQIEPAKKNEEDPINVSTVGTGRRNVKRVCYSEMAKSKRKYTTTTTTPPLLHECPFCDKAFGSIGSLPHHGLYCQGIRKAEPRRNCSHCSKELSLTQSYLHERTCPKNPRKQIECPKCKTRFTPATKGKWLGHLVHCLTYIKQYFRTGTLTEPEESVSPAAKAPIVISIKKEKISSPDNSQPGLSHTALPGIDIKREPEEAVTIVEETSEEVIVPDLEENMDADHDVQEVTMDFKSEIEQSDKMDPFLETGSSIQPLLNMFTKDEEHIQCPFCQSKFVSLEVLKSKHLMVCNGIKAFEPLTNCGHCKLRLPFSLQGLHGVICNQNSSRFILSPDNLRYCDVLCPECKEVFKAKDLPEHLATCLGHLQKILTRAMATGQTCDWNREETEDYVKQAGLQDWLSKI